MDVLECGESKEVLRKGPKDFLPLYLDVLEMR